MTVAMVAAALLSGCGGGGDSQEDGPNVVFSESRSLSDGAYLSIPLNSGNYYAEVTGSVNGIAVEWVGGVNCAKTAEVKAYTGHCTLTQKGQLIIKNPSTFGLGPDEISTIRVSVVR
ncbi:hypothetical protein [Paucibacter sp. KBW04]|uniref:hypothetical protein n=1 Tax=Paucibacter sp. KBW04 TaxID=2153361 RepID=UPI000F585B56|nr:hypothetical protein [Paucibacter sp. KBW04]